MIDYGDVSGAVFIRDGKIFAARRGESKYPYVAHKYEFVGGKREKGEAIEETLVRECREEIDAEITIERPFLTTEYVYPDFRIVLHTFLAELKGEPVRKEHEEFRWIPIAELDEKEWAPADVPAIRKLKLEFGDLTEKKIAGQSIFDGYIMKVRKDTVLLPNGKTAFREMLHHKGAAGILVVDKDNEVYLCRQYRYPIGRVTLEIPAGKRDSEEEDFFETAKREVMEELGVVSAEFSSLGKMIPAVGYSDEVIALYLAKDPVFGEQHTDEDEFLNVVRMPLARAVDLCLSGEIEDSKTAVAILKYAWECKERGILK